jgi:hypothetical protein
VLERFVLRRDRSDCRVGRVRGGHVLPVPRDGAGRVSGRHFL